MDHTRQRLERVLATVEALWAAYDAGDPEYFGFFTTDASIFSLASPTRLQGPDAYRRYCGSQFSSERRATQILRPEVLFVGESALVTSLNRIRVDYRSVDSRTTLLFVPDGDRLKIAHMHMSPLAASSPSDTRGFVEEVTVVWTPTDRSPEEPAS